ncbi:MAG TPA: hypothetical protein VFT22_00385 [Kofleriaceae bacterium]|nr:hypothetical protein [Kofleriaceae bacterium]
MKNIQAVRKLQLNLETVPHLRGLAAGELRHVRGGLPRSETRSDRTKSDLC